MHIIIVAATLIALIAYGLWRARATSAAAEDIVDAAQDAQAALRRFGYRRKAGVHPADQVEDARLAAAGMMAAIARMDGDLTADQMNALRVECRASFRVPQPEADDIAAYGRWLAGQSQDPDDAIRRLARVIRAQAGAEAQKDLIAMLTRVAAVEGGGPSELQSAAIDRVRHGFARTP